MQHMPAYRQTYSHAAKKILWLHDYETCREEVLTLPVLPFLLIVQHLQSIVEHALQMDQTIITVTFCKTKEL